MSDTVYEQECQHFEEAQLVGLTRLVVAINGFNRTHVVARTIGGSYKPGMHSH